MTSAAVANSVYLDAQTAAARGRANGQSHNARPLLSIKMNELPAE